MLTSKAPNKKTPLRSPEGLPDHGTSSTHFSSFEPAASWEGNDTGYPHGDFSILRGGQTIYDIICNQFAEEDDSSKSVMGPEKKEPPTSNGSLNSLSPEDCPTPSEAILSSLGSLSQMYTTFKDFSNKTDLSFANSSNIAWYGRGNAAPKPKTNSGEKSDGSFFPNVRLSLQRLLAEYLRSCWPTSPNPGSTDIGPFDIAPSKSTLQNVFSKENIAFLRHQGYEPEDLVSWAWIVTADSTERAVRRLMALSAESRLGSSESRIIPTFVFLFVLRRSNWSARALRMMIIHGWDRLEGYVVAQKQPLDAAYGFSRTGEFSSVDRSYLKSELQPRGISHRFVSNKNVMIMVIRLLRHAREVWPEACVSIARMFTKYDGKSWDAPIRHSKIAERTNDYNTILSLLASPASMYPFLSISAQQQAQFVIIRRMDEFDPPLTIDRGGFRAVIRVQLAHKKTLQERDWASLKAKSWPPWKQDKLGLDAEKDIQYGQSRASQVIKHLQEAGYACNEWESAAEILAGWDTDETPTIQKRAFHLRPIGSGPMKGEESTLPGSLIWQARIQATRTIDEAWACFLAFKESMGLDGISSKYTKVYHVMAEKIIFEQARSRATEQGQLRKAGPQLADITPLPGDGKEVSERPGPQEAIYVRSSAPDIDEFFDMMLQDGVVPSSRSLAFLLFHAQSFRKGIRYLLHSHLPNDLVRNLLIDNPKPIAYPIHRDRMPDYLFGAFIHFLCNFGRRVHHTDLMGFYLSRLSTVRRTINTVVQACKLMGAYKPYYRPPWNSLLLVLAKKGVSLETYTGNVDAEFQEILAWKAILTVVNDMRMIGLGLDLSGFRYVCIGYENAFKAKGKLTPAAGFIPVGGRLRGRLPCSVRHFMHNGLSYIKDLFKIIVSGGPSYQVSARLDIPVSPADTLVPRLLETPSPAHLHPFIRILGLRGDHRGLVELVEWMGEFAPELQTRAEELMNGRRMLRRCLTAAVVFLEQRWLPPEERMQYGEKYNNGTAEEFGDDAGRTISCESIDPTKISSLAPRFRRVIDENSDWGGWPSDDEIETYIENGLLTELRHEIDSLKDENGSAGGTRALVLASELDQAFCAGADLKERSQMTDDETRDFLNVLRGTFDTISNLYIPTISAISSNALGGGFELALTTDLRVFSVNATVGLPETRLGIVPGAGGCDRLEKLIGTSKARQLILTGSRISGLAAWQMGICNYVVHHKGEEDVAKTTDIPGKRRQEVLDRALKVADEICQGAPVAIAVAMAMTTMTPREEHSLYNTCLTVGRADRDEGLQAFKEKREPIYRGSNLESNSLFKKSPSDQLATAARSANPTDIKEHADVGMVESTRDLGEQCSLFRRVSTLKGVPLIKREHSQPFRSAEKLFRPGDLVFPEHRAKPENRNNDIEALDPAAGEKIQSSKRSRSIHDLFDETFER
ncbi:MAG: hypothetical protein Q9195_007315 [Heterodermia aff. obscurata]